MQDPVLILGIGNLLWADEGFGVRAVEALNQAYELPPTVQVMDGGTQGLYLVPYVNEARYLIVFDAIDYGLPAGTLKVLRNDEVPRFMGAKKMSLHQTGFQDVLASAKLLGRYPNEIVLIGVQPEQLEDYGGSLRPSVRARIDEAIAIAIDQLQKWGVPAQARAVNQVERLNTEALELDRYESERPDEDSACRIGDARVLNQWLDR
jgi:hydrogenase maturation protease